MKYKIFILLILLNTNGINAQLQNSEDSLRAIIKQQKGDTTEVNALVYWAFKQVQFDSAMKYAQQGLLLSQKINYRKGEADCFFQIASFDFTYLKDYSKRIQNLLNALKIYEDLSYNTGIAEIHLVLQGIYRDVGDYKNAMIHAFLGEHIAASNKVVGRIFSFFGHRLAPLFLAEIAKTYIQMNQFDSAEIYIQKSIAQNELFNGAVWNFPIYILGTIQNLKGNYKIALVTMRSAIPLAKKNELFRDTLQIYSGMSTVFKNTGELDSAIYYADMVYRSLNPERETSYWLDAIKNLSQVYKLSGNNDSALKYTEHFYTVKDVSPPLTPSMLTHYSGIILR